MSKVINVSNDKFKAVIRVKDISYITMTEDYCENERMKIFTVKIMTRYGGVLNLPNKEFRYSIGLFEELERVIKGI